jgi:hypothetical protein
MKQLKRAGLPLALALLVAAGSAGCVVRAQAMTPGVPPPPPRYIEVDYRPGYIWIEGRWIWRYSDWYWQPGYYEIDRPGYYYAPGYWERRGGSYVWIDGNWRRGGVPATVRYNFRYKGGPGVRTRDHRPVPVPAPGIETRDHRPAPPPAVRTPDQRPVPDVRTRDHRDDGETKVKARGKVHTKVKTRDHRE